MKNTLTISLSLTALFLVQPVGAQPPYHGSQFGAPPQGMYPPTQAEPSVSSESKSQMLWQQDERLSRAEQRQANMAIQHEVMRNRAEEQKTYLEKHHEEFLQQALDRQSYLAKQYEEMRNRAEEQRAYLQGHHEEFLQNALDFR